MDAQAYMRAVIEASGELLLYRDVDTVCRRSVELAREKLGIEHCALFLDHGEMLLGTYATDDDGHTTAEHENRISCADTPWADRHGPCDPVHPQWRVLGADHGYFREGQSCVAGTGWVVVTRVGGWGHMPRMGVFVNDRHLSGGPLDEVQQEAVVFLCAILASILVGHETEQRLRDSEKRFRNLFTEMTSAFALHEIILNDQGKPIDYRFLEVNEAFETMTGLKRTDLIGRTVLKVLPGIEPVWIERYGKVALTGEPDHFAEYSKELDRHYQVAAFRAGENQFAVVFTDVTPRLQAEKRARETQAVMLQAQKLESLGLLAGGIAHDFNNLLMGVLGHADIAVAELPEGSLAHKSIEQIGEAAKQAADLCRQLLAYSGRGRFVSRPVSLNDVLHETSRLLQVTVSKNTELRYEFADDLPAIEGDPSQIRQVAMNLVINASDAIGESPGVIVLRTGQRFCDAAELADAPIRESPVPGRYVWLEVSDNGCGMDAETRRQMFDPFFSTKFPGRGLGLAAVQGIIRGHGGTMTVTSEEGKGSTFTVMFPASDHGAVEQPEAPLQRDAWSGKGMVLLVDDEPIVRKVTRRYLTRSGFEVMEAGDGAEALALFREHADGIVCIVLDLTMPGMNGDEVFREVRAIRPDVPVVLTSGYSQGDVSQRFADKRLTDFIQKPYTLDVLMDALRTVLSAAEPQG